MTHANVMGNTNYPHKYDILEFFISYETQVWQCVAFPAIFKNYVCTCIEVYFH